MEYTSTIRNWMSQAISLLESFMVMLKCAGLLSESSQNWAEQHIQKEQWETN